MKQRSQTYSDREKHLQLQTDNVATYDIKNPNNRSMEEIHDSLVGRRQFPEK